jgi:predicted amidohydrolase
MNKSHRTNNMNFSAIVGGVLLLISSAFGEAAKTVTVAAIQMQAERGNVERNLEKAEVLVRKAIARGAHWIVLPEFFTTGMVFHETLVTGHRPIDGGSPTQLLRKLAREGGVFVGGSFLASSGDDVYNTFVLAAPDGSIQTHDKDFPSTPGEAWCYAGGEDREFFRLLKEHDPEADLATEIIPTRAGNNVDGVFELGGVSVGVSLCWEGIRYRTAERLLNRNVDFVLAASGWPIWDASSLKEKHPDFETRWKTMLQDMPVRLARLVGAPVVHANLVGTMKGKVGNNPEYSVFFLGESCIVDAKGTVLARRSGEEGEGILVQDVRLGRRESQLPLKSQFWIVEDPLIHDIGWHETSGRNDYIRNISEIRRAARTTGGN